MIFNKYFDKDSTFVNYLKTNDNYSAGKYILDSFTNATNKDDAIGLISEAEDLKRKGRIYQAAMTRANDKQKQAISFLNAFDNGTTLPTTVNIDGTEVENEFTKDFNKTINDFYKDGDIARFVFQTKTVKRNPIPALGVLTDWMVADKKYDMDGYSAFLNNIGMTDDSFRKFLKDNKVGSVGYKNGIPYLNLKHTNLKAFTKIVQALYNTVDEEGNNRWGATMMKYARQENNSIVTDKQGNPVIDENSGYEYRSFRGETSIQNLDDDNNRGSYRNVNDIYRLNNVDIPRALIMTGSVLPNAIHDVFAYGFNRGILKVSDIMDDAKDQENNMIEQNGLDNVYYDIIKIPYKSLGHKQVADARAIGKIKQSVHDSMIKELDDYYNDQIGSFGYATHQMLSNWNNDEETDKVLVEQNAQQRAEIADYISQVYATNHLNYTMGSYGDVTGMYISIPAQTIVPKGAKNSSYKNSKEITVFIPNMFPRSENALFKSDTNFQASSELINMCRKGYDYELSDGSKIHSNMVGGDIKNSRYTIEYANGTSDDISVTKALSLMNKQKIIENSVYGLINDIYDYNGRPAWFKTEDGLINYKTLNQLVANSYNAISEIKPDINNILNDEERIKIKRLETFKLVNEVLSYYGFDNMSIDDFNTYFKNNKK